MNHFPAPAADQARPEVLRVRGLKVWFPIQRGFLRVTRGYVKAVDDVSFAIHPGADAGHRG